MATRCLLFAACAVLVESWSYDRCSPDGPSGWSSIGQCNGNQQTPINLCNAVPFPKLQKAQGKDDDDDDDDDDKSSKKEDKSAYSFSLNGYGKKSQLTVKNTGHTVELSGPTPSLRAPFLSQLVGRALPDTNPNQEWQFAQMHIHWGRSNDPNEGSEHAVANKRFAAEAHFVHFNKARGSTLTQAVQSGKKDALLVVGVFLDLGPASQETELLRTALRYVPGLEAAPSKTLVTSEKLALGELIDSKGAFFSYGGGLTTPGCNEIVTWIVLRKPAIISPQSLASLQTAIDSEGHLISHFGNFRPLLPLGARTLYSTKGSSVACLPEEIPDTIFQCPNPHNRDTVDIASVPETTSSCSTPAWVWVVIGVVIPAAMLFGVLATLAIVSRRQKQCASDELVVFTPMPETNCRSVPNTVVNAE